MRPIGFCFLISITETIDLAPIVLWVGPLHCQPTAVLCGFMVSQNICPKKAREAGTAKT